MSQVIWTLVLEDRSKEPLLVALGQLYPTVRDSRTSTRRATGDRPSRGEIRRTLHTSRVQTDGVLCTRGVGRSGASPDGSDPHVTLGPVEESRERRLSRWGLRFGFDRVEFYTLLSY